MKFAGRRSFIYALEVAPHWGAWIEIVWCDDLNGMYYVSHPTGVRGLKSVALRERCRLRASHPTGVRGLKSMRMTPKLC